MANAYDRAQDAFTRALHLQPGRAEIVQARAGVLRRQGRLAEAAVDYARAVELDPRTPSLAADLASTYAMLRAYPDAMRYFDRAIALAPRWEGLYADQALYLVAWRGDTAGAHRIVREGLAQGDPGRLVARLGVFAPLLLGDGAAARRVVRGLTVASFGHDTVAYLLWAADWARVRGEPARARASAERARRLLLPRLVAAPGDEGTHMLLGRAYAGLGRRDEALAESGRSLALMPPGGDAIDRPNRLFDRARVAALVGALDVAVAHLTELLEVPSDFTPALLRVDPTWAPLRGHPGFARLVGGAAPRAR